MFFPPRHLTQLTLRQPPVPGSRQGHTTAAKRFSLAHKLPLETLLCNKEEQSREGHSCHPRDTAGVPEPKLQPCLGPTAPFKGAILRAAGFIPARAAFAHTYLKTILFTCAFTSCWDENESKGNSRRGTELNCRAPTLTCSRRQRVRGGGVGV